MVSREFRSAFAQTHCWCVGNRERSAFGLDLHTMDKVSMQPKITEYFKIWTLHEVLTNFGQDCWGLSRGTDVCYWVRERDPARMDYLSEEKRVPGTCTSLWLLFASCGGHESGWQSVNLPKFLFWPTPCFFLGCISFNKIIISAGGLLWTNLKFYSFKHWFHNESI